MSTTQKTRHIHLMFDQCWANVVDGALTLVEHWIDVRDLRGSLNHAPTCPAGSRTWLSPHINLYSVSAPALPRTLYQDNYVKQHHEEISLFEQYLRGIYDIGVTLAQRSRHSGVLSTFHLVIITRLSSWLRNHARSIYNLYYSLHSIQPPIHICGGFSW